MAMPGEYIFVYGTLCRKTGSGAYGYYIRPYADFVGEATVQGRLYRVDFYPGLVHSEEMGDLVRGEVFRLRKPEETLARLDVYEGCNQGGRGPDEYIRRQVAVRLATGETIQAWVYIYNQPVEDLDLIASGDFCFNP